MSETQLVIEPNLKIEQILAPHQLQSLEILLAPILELQKKLSQELEENPVLELEKGSLEEISDISPETLENNINMQQEDFDSEDDTLQELFNLKDSWHHPSNNYSKHNDEKHQYLMNSIVVEQSLQDFLLEQLNLSDADARTKEIAELIIGSIDDRGYLRSHLADLAIACNADIKEMERVLSLIQTFDPPGIGARNLKECLLLQLKRKNKENSLIAKIIKENLEDIAKNRLPKISQKFNISMDELYQIIEDIKKLNPAPAAQISSGRPIFVVPDVIVEEKDGKFIVTTNDDALPKLRISNYYLDLLESPDTSKETLMYIKEKIANGKLLLKSINQRQETLKKIAEVIVDVQFEFFKKGPEYLKPLTLQQVADRLGLHETTVSRAIANKYIKTPQGIKEFKYFFTSGYQSETGENISSHSVKEKIKDVIEKEDKSKPLSDSKIAEILKKEGLNVARRTVAKYREDMGIPSSSLRKKF